MTLHPSLSSSLYVEQRLMIPAVHNEVIKHEMYEDFSLIRLPTPILSLHLGSSYLALSKHASIVLLYGAHLAHYSSLVHQVNVIQY